MMCESLEYCSSGSSWKPKEKGVPQALSCAKGQPWPGPLTTSLPDPELPRVEGGAAAPASPSAMGQGLILLFYISPVMRWLVLSFPKGSTERCAAPGWAGCPPFLPVTWGGKSQEKSPAAHSIWNEPPS